MNFIKTNISPFIISGLLGILLVTGCMDNVTGNDNIYPTVNVYKPASNDTIDVGIHEIIYDANDDQGLRNLELYVNDKFISSFAMGSYGVKPAVYWNVDSSMVNKSYSYHLIAYDLKGNATSSNKMTNVNVILIVTPPPAPYDLKVTKINTSTINLSWKDTAKVKTGYEVWRKAGFSGSYEKLKNLTSTSFNTNDQNLDPAITYFYKIRSYNDLGFSPYSNEVNSTGIGGSGSVIPPSNLVGTPFGTSKILLTWQDNSENENYFKIERRTASTLFQSVGFVSVDQNYYRDSGTGLQMNSEYYYRVKAISDSDSSWSSEIAVKTWAFDITKPTNLRAVKSDSVTVKLTWVDNSSKESEYHIERKIGLDGSFQTIAIVTFDSITYDDKSYIPGVLNVYRVKGVSDSGNIYSEYSNEAAITP
jgi:hypothetical protein